MRAAAERLPNRPKTPAEIERVSTPAGFLGPCGIVSGGISEADVTEVVIVRAVLAGETPATTGLLANRQLAPEGKPEQEKVTGDANLPIGVTVSE